jgi:hypothetical protein
MSAPNVLLHSVTVIDAESVLESVAVPPCTQLDEDSQTQMEG